MNSLSYFQSYADYFWQWEDGTDVLAIPNDSTIAYKNHIGDVIEKLSPQGLPPFGAMLLVLIATNPNGGAALDTVYRIISNTLKTTDDAMLTKAISFLRLISSVPNAYKTGTKRMLLLQAIFENSHNTISAKNSKAIYNFYKAGGDDFEKVTTKVEFNHSVLQQDFRVLSLLCDKVASVEDIIEKIAGLPKPLQYEIEYDVNNKPPALDFIDELINNDKTFTVGSLVRWLWSGLNVPVHSSLPSQQPLGGISDLTNKGDYDKLLISEFANDDLLLMLRLANSEALYIHREIPPTNNDLHRVILIDSTLKNWGTPKIMAFAIALAITRHPKTDIACTTYVVGNETYHPVSLDSIHTIIDALQLLEGGLHPARSLDAFLHEHARDKKKEVLFITEASVMKQPALLKVVNEHRNAIQYLFLTNAEGTIDLFKKQHSTTRHIQHIKLPLHSLWKQNKPKPKLEANNVHEAAVNYPILFRGSAHQTTIMLAPDGEIFSLTKEKTLMRFYNKQKEHQTIGWDLLYQNLPFKADSCEIGISDKGHHVLLIFSIMNREIALLNISTGEKLSINFENWQSTTWASFIFRNGKFYHCNRQGTWSIALNGRVASEEPMPHKNVLDHDAVLEKNIQKYARQFNCLKKIDKIFINTTKELVFNIHALRINRHHGQGNHIKLMQEGKTLAAISSKKDGNDFTFADGSSIEINRCGVVILKSSSKMIPHIYIPTTLDSALGVATDNDFAGSEYYFKDPLYDVMLETSGHNTLAAIKAIRELTSCSLEDARHTVANCPTLIERFCAKKRVDHIKDLLASTGAQVVVRPSQNAAKTLPKISTTDFYKKYIEQFINTIQHGVNDRTPY